MIFVRALALLLCVLLLGGCADAIILAAIWWDCGFMAMSFDDCRSTRRTPAPLSAGSRPSDQTAGAAPCDQAELRAARLEYDLPWRIGDSVAERDRAWLRWYRAAEACEVDWRKNYKGGTPL